jgi:hypothetical protein
VEFAENCPTFTNSYEPLTGTWCAEPESIAATGSLNSYCDYYSIDQGCGRCEYQDADICDGSLSLSVVDFNLVYDFELGNAVATGSINYVGAAPTPEDCAILVEQQNPNADGAAWNLLNDDCSAVQGIIRRDTDENWVSAFFAEGVKRFSCSTVRGDVLVQGEQFEGTLDLQNAFQHLQQIEGSVIVRNTTLDRFETVNRDDLSQQFGIGQNVLFENNARLLYFNLSSVTSIGGLLSGWIQTKKYTDKEIFIKDVGNTTFKIRIQNR